MGGQRSPSGPEASRVTIDAYHPLSPTRFEHESGEVLLALAGFAQAAEHIGSTAIEGVAGKHTIDVLIGTHTLEIPERSLAAMAAIGYEHRGEMGVPGREYFRKGPSYPRDYNVHIVVWRGRLWGEYLAFRDYLRAHPERAREYSELKRRILGSPGGSGLAGYSAGKRRFIEETLSLTRTGG